MSSLAITTKKMTTAVLHGAFSTKPNSVTKRGAAESRLVVLLANYFSSQTMHLGLGDHRCLRHRNHRGMLR